MDKPFGEKPAVLIFAKAPVPGHCKTRMQPELAAAESAGLQDALIRDLMLLKDELEPNCAFWVAYDPPGCESYFLQFSCRLILQEGNDLGERIRNGLSHLFSTDFHPILIIGTDTPLCTEDIHQAFQQLEKRNVVMGPAMDGGYYMLGLSEYEPQLFQGISWGTNQVFRQTCEQVQKLGLEVSFMEPKRDIDCWGDLVHYRSLKTSPHLDQWKQEFFQASD